MTKLLRVKLNVGNPIGRLGVSASRDTSSEAVLGREGIVKRRQSAWVISYLSSSEGERNMMLAKFTASQIITVGVFFSKSP